MRVYEDLTHIFTDKKIPLAGLFEVTYVCNLKCQHCCVEDEGEPVINEGNEELSLEEIKSTLDELYKMHTFALVFSGGEAMTRPDIFDILSYARKLNFRINLYTNATLIDENAADELKKLKVNNIGISLYGATAKTHDTITRVPGSYEATTRAISLLQERGLYITLKSLIMKPNFSETKKLREWSKKRNIFHEFSFTIHPLLNGSKKNTNLRLSDEEAEEFTRQTLDIEFARDSFIDQEEIPNSVAIEDRENICPAGVTSFNISPYGDVYPCVYLRLPAGNIRNTSFASAWNAEIMQTLRKTRFTDLKKCSKCDLAEEWCGVCPGHAFLEVGDWLEPSPEACRRARIRREIYGKARNSAKTHV